MIWTLFLLFLFCKLIWGVLPLTILLKYGRLLCYSHLTLGFFFVGLREAFNNGFYFTGECRSIYLSDFNLTLINDSYWENYSFLIDITVWWRTWFKVCPWDSLDFLSIRCYVPIQFLILLIWIVFAHLYLAWMRVYLSCWFSQRTNSFFHWFLYNYLYFYFMGLAVSLIISSGLILLDIFSFVRWLWGVTIKYDIFPFFNVGT